MAKTSTTTRLAYQNEIQSWYTKSFIISSLDFLKVTFVGLKRYNAWYVYDDRVD